MFTRDIVIASVALSLILASPGHRPQLAAQGQTPGTADQSSAPVFRSGADAIQVDVSVTDKDGRLITDLVAEDFEIFENSIRQDITTFANIDRPSATGPEDFGDVESDVASNTGTKGRTYVIAIDTLTGETALRGRQLMKSFIDDYLGPNDTAAVIPIGQSLRASRQDFTSSKVRLHEALDRTAVEVPVEASPGDTWTPEAWATGLYDDEASPTDFAGHAELRDATGKVVLSKPLERVPGESGMLEGYRMWVTVPLAGVPAGTYALQVHSQSGD